jgi:hypothetical protein
MVSRCVVQSYAEARASLVDLLHSRNHLDKYVGRDFTRLRDLRFAQSICHTMKCPLMSAVCVRGVRCTSLSRSSSAAATLQKRKNLSQHILDS